jgi:hypothetical protein
MLNVIMLSVTYKPIMLSIFTLNVIMLSVTYKPIMLSVIYAECHYAECHL